MQFRCGGNLHAKEALHVHRRQDRGIWLLEAGAPFIVGQTGHAVQVVYYFVQD